MKSSVMSTPLGLVGGMHPLHAPSVSAPGCDKHGSRYGKILESLEGEFARNKNIAEPKINF